MDPRDKGKRVGSFLDKISTLSRSKDRKEKSRGDSVIMRQRTIEELARDEQQMFNFQQTINRLSDIEINSKFEQMLDDMNLSDEKKAPLREKKTEEKRALLAMQFKGSIQPKGKIDSPEEFIDILRSAELRGDRCYEIISSLRVALTNNTVTWVLNFGKQNGLNAILKTLNYCYENKLERRSTLECVKCLRAYTNNRSGLMEMVTHEEALTILSRCINPRDPPSMLEAVKLLAAICLVPPDGQKKVLEGITVSSELRGIDRFLPIIQGLTVKDWQIKVTLNRVFVQCDSEYSKRLSRDFCPYTESSKIACLQLINSIVSTTDELEFRLHLRNEFMRTGLAECIEQLERADNEEVKTHVRIFIEHRDEDAEEIYHHFDNIRFEMDDPKECFEILFNTTLNTPAEPYFLSILQHLLSIRDDVFARPQYYKLIEECVSQIVLNKQGLDPDFRYTKRFKIDVEPLLGRLSDDTADDMESMSTAPRQFRSKLEDAITAKQEFEAKVSTLDEKVKQYEAEIADLKLRITQGVGAVLSSSLASGSSTHHGNQPGATPGSIPPPPSMLGLSGGPAPPVPPPFLPGNIPKPPGGQFAASHAEQLPSFVKPKKKYSPEIQMKRANWTKINVKALEKDSFWATANEERLAKDDIFKGLMVNFAVKVSTSSETKERLECKSLKKCKELKVLDPRAAQNLSILLGSVKVPYEEIKRRIIEMDDDNLTVGLIEQLIKYLPSPDHMRQLEAYRGEYQSLAEPEQFAIVMSGIKRVIPRLTSMTFKMKFNEMVSELKPDIVVVTAGLEEVKQSRKFSRILELVLLMGNYMNAGSRNERTFGFELSFMPKLVNTKTIDNTRTLMHYLVEIAEKHFPDVIDLDDELLHVDKAARVSEDSLQKNITLMSKSLKQLEIDVRNVQQDKNIPPNDQFLPVMTFVNNVKEQCAVLEGMHKKMTSLYMQTAKFFCFDPKMYGIEEFFSDIKAFMDAFTQAKKDLEKEKESFEKAKRVKEAQERREKERKEKIARTNALVDMNNAEDDQEGVMENLIEALKTGSAFNVTRERKDMKKRTPRAAGAERRAQLARSRSRQNVLSPDAGGSSGILREINFDIGCSLNSTPVANSKRTPRKGQSAGNGRNGSSSKSHRNGHEENNSSSKSSRILGYGDASSRSEAEELLERLRAL